MQAVLKCNRRCFVLAACLAAMVGIFLFCVFGPPAVTAIFRREFNPTRWVLSGDVPADSLRIRVVDERGIPVEGAFVGDILSGNYTNRVSMDEESPAEHFRGLEISVTDDQHAVLRFIEAAPLPKSSEEGVIVVSKEVLLAADPRWQSGRPGVLYVIHPERRLGGLVCYRARDLGCTAEITLRPLCRVQGKIARADGQVSSAAKTVAYWGPLRQWRLMPIEQGGRRTEVNLLLPPGKYTLRTAYLERDKEGVLWAVEDWKKVDVIETTSTMGVNMLLKRAKHPARIAAE